MLKECVETGAGEIIQEQEVKELGTLKTRSGRQINKRKERGKSCLPNNQIVFIAIQ
jgi:hypothetical protein